MTSANRRCPGCGRPFSRLIYAPFCAVASGIVGSLIGFTLTADIPSALLGGLGGILLAEAGARLLLRSPAKDTGAKDQTTNC